MVAVVQAIQKVEPSNIDDGDRQCVDVFLGPVVQPTRGAAAAKAAGMPLKTMRRHMICMSTAGFLGSIALANSVINHTIASVQRGVRELVGTFWNALYDETPAQLRQARPVAKRVADIVPSSVAVASQEKQLKITPKPEIVKVVQVVFGRFRG